MPSPGHFLAALTLLAAGPSVAGPLQGLTGKETPVGFGDSRDRVAISVVADRTRVAPGDQVRIAVILDHHPGWHIHTNDPQVPPALGLAEDYYATVIEVQTPPDSPLVPHPAFIEWPRVVEIDVGWMGEPVRYGVFEGRAIAYLPVTVKADARPGPATLIIKPGFQACDEYACISPTPYPPLAGEEPSDRWLEYGYPITLQIVPLAEAQGRDDIDRAIFGGFPEHVWGLIASGAKLVEFDLFGWVSFELNAGSAVGFLLVLLVAALGGCLLNFTPCVLPVIPIKIMSLSRNAGNRGRTLVLGSVMSLGIVAFWIGLAVPIALVSTFTATNQLFQYPAFTIGVGLVIAVLAVGMCGVFSLRLPHAVYQFSPTLESIPGSFGFGVMVAILSTPCTAPFMGAAAAWATTETPGIVLATFAAIGAGMAVPYQFLSTFPHLVDRMPRTGPASELIKQVMGLLMLAAAAYFVGVGLSGLLATAPQPPSRAYWGFVGAFGVAAGAWLAIKTFLITSSATKRALFGGIGAFILAASAYIGIRFTDKGPIDWVYYTPQRFADATAQGRVVVMEFTAEWCLNCKALEESVLRNRRIVELLGGPNVVPIKVDLTGNNVAGNEMLAAVDRLTIPLLVVFGPDGQPVFKGDYYTVDQVLRAVEEARRGGLVAEK